MVVIGGVEAEEEVVAVGHLETAQGDMAATVMEDGVAMVTVMAEEALEEIAMAEEISGEKSASNATDLVTSPVSAMKIRIVVTAAMELVT